MAAPAVCHLCDRLAPLGGVPDDFGRPVHYWCRLAGKLATAAHARSTAKLVARYGPARSTMLSEVASESDCAVRPDSSLTSVS